ncbi:MAG: helix-turn-helix domain-containing protein [Propionibacteriaceae bacterium]|jgi:hypothetical protein|nr:helix-turn-helix domain-containing protein [Propionibacteriaceae bacterium]
MVRAHAISLGQLTDLVGPGGLTVLAGSRRAQVTGVVGLSDPSQLEDRAEPGDLVLALGQPPTPGWPLDSWLRRCRAKGVVAIGLGPLEAPLDRGTLALAERLEVALVECQDPWSAGLALHRALTADPETSAGRASALALNAVERSGPEVHQVIEALSGALAAEFVLLDAAGQQFSLGPDVLSPTEAEAVGRFDAKGRLAIVGLPSGRELIAAPLPHPKGGTLWIGALTENPTALERTRLMTALRVGGLGVWGKLATQLMSYEQSARHRTALLGEVLDAVSAGVQPSRSLIRRSLALGWELGSWQLGLRLILREEADPVVRRQEIVDACAAQGLTVQMVEQVDGWTGWVSLPEEPNAARVEELSASLRRAHRLWNQQVATAIGLGHVRAGVEGLAASLGEAADAARIAMTRPQTGHFVHVDRLGLAQMLLALARTDTFLTSAKALLAPLGPVDGPLSATLEAYLSSGGHANEVAARLGVHRNTVAARLSRIKTLLGVDLEDSETRLALHLACRAILSHPDRPGPGPTWPAVPL